MPTRQRCLALAVLAACLTPFAAGLVAVPAHAATSSAQLDVLLGPQTPITATPNRDALIAEYDAHQVRLGRLYAERFPEVPGDIMSSNFYDVALSLYTIHARTGSAWWRDRARTVARAWRDAPSNQNIAAFLAGNWSLGPTVPPARGMSTLGLAVLAAEAHDARARSVVNLHARLAETYMAAGGYYGLGNPYMPLGDAREAGYALMALVAATVLGDDHRPAARQLLDAILARQQATGQWLSWSEPMGTTTFTLNYMNGILMEALILYDRAIGDARIVPALQRAIAWTWSTQWLPSQQTFQYGNIVAGSIDTSPAWVLNGLMLPAWGYVGAKTQDPVVRTQGRQIFEGVVEKSIPEIYAAKQFGQVFRSSSRYLGWGTAPTTSPPPSTSSSVVPLPGAVGVLAGPLTPIKSTPNPNLKVASYDAWQLEQGRIRAERFPEYPGDLVSSNYYDLALVLYATYYRTGDAYWLGKARDVARTWRDSINNQSIDGFLAGNWSLGSTVPPARGFATLGLAVLAVESNDLEARRIVNAQARLVEVLMQGSGNYGVNSPIMPLGDAREAGYGLMALVAASVLGDDHRASARQLLDAILARQQPSGQWLSWSEAMGNTTFTLNFMNGLLMEALVLYDRAIGDPRIVPALQRAIAWTWSTQWLPAARAFQYGNINAGSVDTSPAPVLSGLLLPAWGYVLSKTGDAAVRDQAAQVFDGFADIGMWEVYGVKQFDQVFRSSNRYLGFTAP